MHQTYLAMKLCPPSEEHVLAEPRGTPTGPLPCCGIDNLQVHVPHNPVHTEAGRFSGLPSISMTNPWQERRTPVTSSAQNLQRLLTCGGSLWHTSLSEHADVQCTRCCHHQLNVTGPSTSGRHNLAIPIDLFPPCRQTFC